MHSSKHLETAAHFSERFNSPADRARATQALAEMKEAALPILEAIFSGAAKNLFDVSYRDLGQPLACSYVTASKLGVLAQSLEPYVHEGIRAQHIYAVEAISRMGPLSELSISLLTDCVAKGGLVAWEASAILRSVSVYVTPPL